jgi:hypothetical protein
MVTFDEIEKAVVSDLPMRKRVEAFFIGTKVLSEFAESVIIPVLYGQLNLNDREKAISGTYYRMYGWMHSMVVMNRCIHFQGAATAARTLYELLLDLKILAADKTSDSVERFHAFPEVEKYRVAKKLVSFVDSHPNSTKDVSRQRKFIGSPGRKQKIDKAVIKSWGKTKKGLPKYPKHWTGMSVFERARDLGIEYEELYHDAYPLLSWLIHSGSTGYAGLKEEALEAYFGRPHIIAQKAFIEATIICAEELKISYVIEDVRTILEDIRLTPGKVIVEEQIKILGEAAEGIHQR